MVVRRLGTPYLKMCCYSQGVEKYDCLTAELREKRLVLLSLFGFPSG